MLKRHLFQISLLALLASCSLGCMRSQQVVLPAGARGEAPDFTLNDMTGKPITLSQYKGKVILLDFWATWCGPCAQEIPHFVELSKKYQDKGLAIIGVSIDEGGAAAVKPFIEEHKVDYPIVLGNADLEKSYGGIQGIPTTFIINKSGKVVDSFVGYRDIDVFEKKIQSLL